MKTIKKKFIVDEHGVPKEVILSFKDFQEIERLLSIGPDLDAETINNLRKARRDREKKNKDAHVDLDSI